MSFTAFAGGLSRLTHVPGFDFPGESAAFSGVFTGFTIARDFEYGFARRLLIAAPLRGGLIAGYVVSALMRWSLVAVVLTVVALVAGMDVGGNGIDLVGLYTLAVLVNIGGTLWASGIALRGR